MLKFQFYLLPERSDNPIQPRNLKCPSQGYEKSHLASTRSNKIYIIFNLAVLTRFYVCLIKFVKTDKTDKVKDIKLV